MLAGPLPSDGAATIIFRPHLGQFEYAVANECPLADALELTGKTARPGWVS